MIDHVSVAVSDLPRAVAFYDATLEALGAARLWTAADAAGYGYGGTDEPFAIRRRAGSAAGRVADEAHVAFAAATRAAVATFHARALAHGGTDDGAPGLHPEYGSGYCAAFVRDPDGNRLEAVLHERAEP